MTAQTVDNMWPSDHGMPGLNWFDIANPTPKSQRITEVEKSWKEIKDQESYSESVFWPWHGCCTCEMPQYDCLNNTCMVATSWWISMKNGKELSHDSPIDKGILVKNGCWKRGSWFSPGVNALIGYLIPVVNPTVHVYIEAMMKGLGRLLCIHVFVCRLKCVTEMSSS